MLLALWTIFMLVIQCRFVMVFGECPIDEFSYAKWSESSTWTDQNGEIPDNANITINTPVLLDVVNQKEIFSITIGEPNGILLFSNNVDISLRVHYILIKDKGSLIIGSEECKHTANVLITLVGNQSDYDIQGFNEKFIGTDVGGTIELHGKYKLPWTKLTKTVHKLDKDHGVLYRRSDDPDIDPSNGLVVHVFDRATGFSEQSIIVQLGQRLQHKTDEQTDMFESFLNGIENGKIVAMAIKSGILGNNITRFYDLMRDLTGSDVMSNVYGTTSSAAYTGIVVKGDTTSTVEKVTVGTPSEVSMTFMEEKRKFYVTSNVGHKSKYHYVEFEIIDTDFAIPIINLNNDASTWEVGDKIVLTSTDYDWEQAEECTLVQCDSCTSKQIRAVCDPKHTHFGDMCDNLDMLDMRGEVGLLTRNIKIMGETDGVFGGHIKMLKGFKNAHFEGLELTKMGQNTALGRYPIHFHMCEDVGKNTYEKPSYIRGNSIHHTFARGTTIHGTHGCTIHYNFVYDTLGHALFLEDGGEQYNVFEWNLVGGQRKSAVIVSDKSPSSFWMTNPKTYVRNNIAFGSDGVGFWFVYPDLPVGPSRDKGFMGYEEAKHTAIYEFENNIAHSNGKAGLFIDHIMFEDTSTHSYNVYSPWQNPFNSSFGPKEVYLRHFTAFKNLNQNIWNRGSTMTLEYCSLADSRIGAQLMKDLGGTSTPQVMQKCIVIGDSCNVGQYEGTIGDRVGFKFNKGPSYVFDTYFDNFTDTSSGNLTALLIAPRDGFTSTTQHKARGLLFGFDDSETQGRRVFAFNENLNFTKDPIGTFKDEDGSVSGISKSQLVLLHDFLLTPDCKIRNNWEAAACPNYYAELEVKGGGKGIERHLARDDDPSLVDISVNSRTYWSNFMIIPGGKFSYILAHPVEVASPLRIKGSAITRSEWVRVGLCVPRYNATFTFKAKNMPEMTAFTKVDTVEEVDNDDTGASYMYDSDVGVIFVKIINKYDRTSSYLDTNECPQSKCAELYIYTQTGDRTDSYCFSRAYDKYKKTIQFNTADPYPEILPATATSPPVEWGAGLFPPVPSPPYQ